MTDIFAQYQQPGVYTREEPTPLVRTIGVSPTVVAIMGPSVGYRIHSQAVTLNGTDAVVLERTGINASSVSVAQPGGLPVDADDYDLTPSGTGPDGTLSIARSTGSTLGSGETVLVSYRYTDSGFYAPFASNDYEDIKAAFGEPFDADGNILSPVSLAAQVAFENGAGRVVVLAVEGDASSVTAANLNSGYSKLLAVEEANVIVPLPVGITGDTGAPGDVHTVGSNLAAHLQAANSTGLGRVGIIGYESTIDIDPADVAGAINSPRVMMAWPNQVSFHNSLTNQAVTLPGYYLAAAYAGRMASLPVQEPLTLKQIRGFTGIPSPVLSGMTRPVKNGWSQGGVSVTEPRPRRGLVVRHAISTVTANDVHLREMSITRARDTKIQAILSSIEAAELIGTPIVEETPARLQGVVQGVLETMVERDVIVGYTGLTVRQLSLDPTVMEVKYQYRPAYPMNYILISFSIDTTTGAVTEGGVAA